MPGASRKSAARELNPTLDDERRAHRALGGVSRVRILELLRAEGGGLDAREVAERVGLHPNTVRVHLDLLVRSGLITREPEPRSTPGRPRILYRAGAEPPGLERSGYKLLAEVLAGYLAGSSSDPTADAERAGRAWGAFLADQSEPLAKLSPNDMIERVMAMLGDLGFRPELDPRDRSGRRILLRHCPFHDVAERHPEIVCSVHLGLMRGALQELGANVQTESLEPFVEPSLCIANLSVDRTKGKKAS